MDLSLDLKSKRWGFSARRKWLFLAEPSQNYREESQLKAATSGCATPSICSPIREERIFILLLVSMIKDYSLLTWTELDWIHTYHSFILDSMACHSYHLRSPPLIWRDRPPIGLHFHSLPTALAGHSIGIHPGSCLSFSHLNRHDDDDYERITAWLQVPSRLMAIQVDWINKRAETSNISSDHSGWHNTDNHLRMLQFNSLPH